MTSHELRQKYLEFFKQKGHAIIPSASLIPENDPSVLFTTAGMHPLVPYLLGEKHPGGRRLVNCQKCIRTGDIDEVGDDCHLTFFEMLGNWSLGDPDAQDGIGAGYFKKESIAYSWEFLTSPKWLGIDVDKLAFTVFAGDKDAPFDADSFKFWRDLGVAEARIAKLGKDDNWWPAGGKHLGPQGPDTEIFYWSGHGKAPKKFHPSDKKWVEIWNNVFMEFDKQGDGSFKPLKQKNIDTGMGLERTLAVLEGKPSVYDTELFQPIFRTIEELSGKKYETYKKEFRIIADHVKAAIFIMADGVTPLNVGPGYVLRRLIRRAVRFAGSLEIKDTFTFKLAEVVVNQMKGIYPELKKNNEFIINQLILEEEKFAKTLANGLREFKKLENKISGRQAFDLFQSYGFPFEMTEELAKERSIAVDKEEFDEEFKKHQDLSRLGAEKKFKGGLADASEETTKLHTATHLLQAALRKILGEHVFQKGSNITAERLRFDFTHPEKMTTEQIKLVEDLVNEWISKDYEVKCDEMPFAEAKKLGIMGLFENKYGDMVKVYRIGPSASSGQSISSEMCGGPHVEHTGALGEFRIKKEEASSAGVRRIKAILI
ncbi:MAG: alanine--tRNA ligase [Parcubacteria group bacterium]